MTEKRPILVEVFRDINHKEAPLDEVVSSIEQLKDLDVQLGLSLDPFIKNTRRRAD